MAKVLLILIVIRDESLLASRVNESLVNTSETLIEQFISLTISDLRFEKKCKLTARDLNLIRV